MGYTLSNLLQDTYNELGQSNIALVTGSTSVTTVADTLQTGNHSDDDWKEGTLFVVRSSAAPDEEFQRISAYTDSIGLFTVDTAFSASPRAGDTYLFTGDYYPLRTLIGLSNRALSAIGDMPLVDTMTLDSAGNQTEYTADVAWKRRRPLQIDIQGLTNDANDNRWVTIYNWEFVPAAAGSTGKIVFDEQLPSTRDIRIWYVDVHGTLSIYSDVINETIHPELMVAATVERALRWQNRRLQGAEPFLLQTWNDAKVEFERAKLMHPIWKPGMKSKLNIVSQPYEDVGEPDKVRF